MRDIGFLFFCWLFYTGPLFRLESLNEELESAHKKTKFNGDLKRRNDD